MKRLQKIIALALITLTLCIVGLFAGCKDPKQTLTGIAIKSGEEPRLTYVQGQNLDLSSGLLTLIKEDVTGNETVALNAPEIIASGYDANKLGTQTVTFAYGEFTTTMEVKVVARMTISNYKIDYMLGEAFSTKGTVTIANDDGTTFNVPLSDSAVTVEGFDSSEVATPLTLTAKYTSGETTYTATFNVSVKEAEEVRIIVPTNKIQYSHQQELDLTGGQIIVKFGGKQSAITIDESMISGYDPSKATVDNMETPLKQTVTISYARESKSYEVDVYFSAVSLMKLRASQFDDLQYNEKDSTIEPDDTFGPQALKAMTEYFKLKESEKDLITDAEKDKVVRHAVAYGRVELANVTAEYANTFFIDNGGFVWMVDGTHADAVKAYEAVCDENSQFVTLGTLLYQIKEEFAETVLVEEVDALVETNVPEAYSKEELDFAKELLSFILDLHDQLAEVIPIDDTTWTKEDVLKTEVSTKISSIVGKIMNCEYNGYDFLPIFEMLSSWRKGNDYFDIIYTNYYYGGEAKQQMIKEEMFQTVPLPNMLQDLYIDIANGFFLADAIMNNPTEMIWYETVDIFGSYKDVLEKRADIEANGNELCKALYEFLDMDTFIDTNLVYKENGYVDQAGEMYGDVKFDEIWNAYLDLFTYANEYGEIDFYDETTNDAFAQVFKTFVNASPSWQYGFIASMHNQYREIDRYSKENNLALDYSDNEASSTFVYLFATYFNVELSYKEGDEVKNYDDAQDICKDLFKAIELYALRNRFNTLEDFQMTMEDVEYEYDNLRGEEKTAFDKALGYAYEKYVALAKKSQSTATTAWGEWQSTVTEMKDALTLYFQMESTINNPTMTADQKEPFYPMLFAAYEKALSCGNKLDAITDTDLLYGYYHDVFVINDTLTCSLEYALWKARNSYISAMLTASFTLTKEDGSQIVRPAWELYAPSGIQSFIAEAYYIMATQQTGATFDGAKVLAVMEAYRAVDPETMSIFYSFTCNKLYHDGIAAYFGTLADDTEALGIKLIEVEKKYQTYAVAADKDKATKLEEFKTAWTEAVTAYDGVTTTAEYNTNLKAMYEFYLAKYNEANTPAA